MYRRSIAQDHIAAKFGGHARDQSLSGRVIWMTRYSDSDCKSEDALPHARRARQSATV